jgi:hypothetical protein
VDVALAGGTQGLHAVPQELTAVLALHAPPHRWNPAPQLNPHAVPSHVALALATAGQLVHEAPQVDGEVLLAHAPAQAW